MQKICHPQSCETGEIHKNLANVEKFDGKMENSILGGGASSRAAGFCLRPCVRNTWVITTPLLDRYSTPYTHRTLTVTMTEITFTMNVAAAILLAEDREDDIVLIQRAFQKGGIRNPLFVVRDGEEAINYLTGVFPFSDRERFPIPALLLLDLKMPRMDGFEVLAWLGTQPDFKDLPVVVLSSSPDDSDIQKARQLGARDYFIKPHALSDWVKILESLQSRYLN